MRRNDKNSGFGSWAALGALCLAIVLPMAVVAAPQDDQNTRSGPRRTTQPSRPTSSADSSSRSSRQATPSPSYRERTVAPRERATASQPAVRERAATPQPVVRERAAVTNRSNVEPATRPSTHRSVVPRSVTRDVAAGNPGRANDAPRQPDPTPAPRPVEPRRNDPPAVSQPPVQRHEPVTPSAPRSENVTPRQMPSVPRESSVAPSTPAVPRQSTPPATVRQQDQGGSQRSGDGAGAGRSRTQDSGVRREPSVNRDSNTTREQNVNRTPSVDRSPNVDRDRSVNRDNVPKVQTNDNQTTKERLPAPKDRPQPSVDRRDGSGGQSPRIDDVRKRLGGDVDRARGMPSGRGDRGEDRKVAPKTPEVDRKPGSDVTKQRPPEPKRDDKVGAGGSDKPRVPDVEKRDEKSAGKPAGRGDVTKDAPKDRGPADRNRPDRDKQPGGPKNSVGKDDRKGDVRTPDAHKVRFADDWKAGKFNQAAAGEAAKKVQLAEQYRLRQQGDIARRMQLEKHRDRHDFYHGPISPVYRKSCFQYRYWGPSFFVGVCWYPTWSNWVSWSWNYHCHPYWDPRPIWCRPVIYEPYTTWAYWSVPVWQPLPVVECGTWVDLKPVVVPPEESDLELVAVRFVDPGHPEEKTGPRYRVWFRNNSNKPVTQPFVVMLMAGINDRLSESLPRAGVRVRSIEANDVQSVDIRLPMSVYSMGRDAQGAPQPFSVLHVLVDANQQIRETTKANNGARLAPAAVLPVDPASFEIEPVTARAEDAVLLAGEGFGPQPGRVLLNVQGKEFDAEILGWYDLGVRWAVPKLGLPGPVEADVIVIRGDGAAANPLRITITP